jgi:hypothetical protein
MSALVDNVIALRMLYLFITPFNKTDAFKLGIIDSTGKPLKKASQLKTNAEQDSYSMLHRLVFRLKRVLGTIPFGQTNLASYAAAYALVKEGYEANEESEYLEEMFISMLNEIEDDNLSLEENINMEINYLLENNKELNSLFKKKLSEDGEVIGNTTAGIEDSTPRIYPKKNKLSKKIRFKRVSKAIFNQVPKMENTLYHVGEDLYFIPKV